MNKDKEHVLQKLLHTCTQAGKAFGSLYIISSKHGRFIHAFSGTVSNVNILKFGIVLV